MNQDSETSTAKDVDRDPSLRLLQALNDRKTNFLKAAGSSRLRSWFKRKTVINMCLRANDVKTWINSDVDPKRLVNPVVDFKDVESVTCLTFASLVNDARTVRQLVEWSRRQSYRLDWLHTAALRVRESRRGAGQGRVHAAA